jgi:serine/threonine-protein kinase SRK2
MFRAPYIERLCRNQFEVEDVIASTLQGHAYLASENKDLGRYFVIKTVDKSLSVQKKSAKGSHVFEDLFTELTLLFTLSQNPHPNIIGFHGVYEDPFNSAIILEYAEGGDLLSFLQDCGPLSEKVAKLMFKDILSGLLHMHSLNICHLDISLENILLNQDGVPKICDFGVATFSDCFNSRFPQGIRPGKLRYMPPEFFDSTICCNPFLADVYSLGIVLFCLIYGSHPYDNPRSAQDKNFNHIRNGRSEFLIMEMDKLHGSSSSPELLHLLANMIAPIGKRISLPQIVNHPWLSTSQ